MQKCHHCIRIVKDFMEAIPALFWEEFRDARKSVLSHRSETSIVLLTQNFDRVSKEILIFYFCCQVEKPFFQRCKYI